MLDQARAIQPTLVELRRAIHRQPELGFEVHKTAALVARTLAELGVEYQAGVGRTGVVAYLGDGAGPVIGIRADMDALPILEANDVEYKSQVPGKMHACGHDAHTSMLLGVATLLSRQRIAGQVRLLFQPSEEIGDAEGISGAPRMIADGAMQGVEAVIALHVDSQLDAGKITIEDGKVAAAVDSFRAHVMGTGGHGALPDKAIDPIWLSTHVLNAMYAVPSRRIDPLQPSVLSIGVVRGGEASNVIPKSVYIEGTLRSMDDKVRAQLLEEVKRCLEIARLLGGDYTLEIETGYPPMFNDPAVAHEIRDVALHLLGADGLGPPERSMGAEDFSYMTRLADGAMFMLGTKAPNGPARFAHTPNFDIDENALPIGTAMLAQTALRLLEQRRRPA